MTISNPGKLLAFLAAASFFACKEPEPSPAIPHFTKGDQLFRANDFAAAAEEYAQALKLDPKQDTKTWEKAAFTYLKAGNHDKAGEYLLKGLETKPSADYKLETYKNLAGMFLQAGNLDQAEHWYGEVMKLDPKDDQSLTWLAEIASIRGGARSQKAPVSVPQLETAISRYDQVIVMTPATPTPYINKRIALIRYANHLNEQIEQTKDKDVQKKLQARVEELKVRLDVTTKKLSEVSKAARASR